MLKTPSLLFYILKSVSISHSRIVHNTCCLYVRKVSSRKKASHAQSTFSEDAITSEFQPTRNINENFYGIESDHGVINVTNIPNSSTINVKDTVESRDAGEEKYRTAKFGFIRLDSENKLRFHGQFEDNSEKIDIPSASGTGEYYRIPDRFRKLLLLGKRNKKIPQKLPKSEDIMEHKSGEPLGYIPKQKREDIIPRQSASGSDTFEPITHTLSEENQKRTLTASYFDEHYFPENPIENQRNVTSHSQKPTHSDFNMGFIDQNYFNGNSDSNPAPFEQQNSGHNVQINENTTRYIDENNSFNDEFKHRISETALYSAKKEINSYSSAENGNSLFDECYFNSTVEKGSAIDPSLKKSLNNEHLSSTNSVCRDFNLSSVENFERNMVCNSSINSPAIEEQVIKTDVSFPQETWADSTTNRGESVSEKISPNSSPEHETFEHFKNVESGVNRKIRSNIHSEEERRPKFIFTNVPDSLPNGDIGTGQSHGRKDLKKDAHRKKEKSKDNFTNVKKSNKSLDLSDNVKNDKESQDKTAFDFVENLRKEKKFVDTEYQRAQRPKLFTEKLDSQGFRVLKYQVPDLKYNTQNEIVDLLSKNVLYADDDVVVLNKPYSLVMHESKTTKDACLSSVLDALAQQLDKQNRNPKLITVHRLDKETTGCLLLARNEIAAQRLKSLFAQRKITKTYWIVTTKVPNPLEGVIDIPISEGSVEKKSRMVLHPVIPKDVAYENHSKRGKRAVTNYKVIADSGNAALVEVQPETGVKHQIRVHFGFALSCPILGDHKYSHLKKLAPQKLQSDLLQKLKVRQSKVRYIPMHIYARSILIPQYSEGRNLFVQSPMPHHMSQNLQKLKFTKD